MADPGTEEDGQVNTTVDPEIIRLLKRRYPTARNKSEAARFAIQDSIDDLPDEIVQRMLDEEE